MNQIFGIVFHFEIVYVRHFFQCCIWSAMGYYVYMDENGDAEGNYSLVSLCDINLWRRNNNREYSSQDTSYVTDHGSRISILLNDICKWFISPIKLNCTVFQSNIMFRLFQMIEEKRIKHYGLCPTGTFQKSSATKDSLFTLPELRLTRSIDWPGSSVPRAVPLCGFEV